MIEWLIGVLALIIAFFGLLLHSATNSRMRAKDEELEEWSGVTDVRRKARDKLDSDPDYVKRVQDHFSD